MQFPYKPGRAGVEPSRPTVRSSSNWFRARKLPVLVNVAVLTEGVDVPSARKTAFLARPTGSEVPTSQMVGRALRGENVGGTPHAYLVSFRDHWDQFVNWMDPIQLPGISEIAGGDLEEPAQGRAEDGGRQLDGLDGIDWSEILADGAVREATAHIHATVHSTWSRVPVGLYMFETEVPVDAEDEDEEEVDARAVHVWVYEHDQSGFDVLTDAVADGTAGVDVVEWLERFFSETPQPQPARSRLELLARFVASEGSLPEFIPLVRRDEIDPAKVARRLYDADARRSEKDAAIRSAYEANPRLVDAFYGGEQGLRREGA